MNMHMRHARTAITCTVRVNGFGQLKGVRCGHIRVSRCDSQDKTSVFADELHYHVPDLRFNVGWLIPNRDLGQTGKIDESDAQHCEMRQKRQKGEEKEKFSLVLE